MANDDINSALRQAMDTRAEQMAKEREDLRSGRAIDWDDIEPGTWIESDEFIGDGLVQYLGPWAQDRTLKIGVQQKDGSIHWAYKSACRRARTQMEIAHDLAEEINQTADEILTEERMRNGKAGVWFNGFLEAERVEAILNRRMMGNA